MTIKVVVADDHDLVRVGIARMLEDVPGIEVVGEAGTGEEAIQYAKQLDPDVVLMDIKMPGIGGIEATKKLTQRLPGVAVVALTALDDNPFPNKLLKAGALGYVTKGAEMYEMVTAIKHAAAGKRYLSPNIAQQMALSAYDSESSPFEQLSDRELQITMMVINCEKVQEISDKLCLSTKTVNSYRYRIFDKLGVQSDVELTRLAIRHGMLDPQEV
ncbi:Response regulator GacA [BD1-7 clade bacterium]|uniref:Response regulator GacA n=1 Tax=BD1-7 clade bacterium TaxID=2029982 RepID=A0A5S9NUJ5_9GAMM|nr:Response regulator GacA [BD1-7 clade bacterium]CAA0094354.1 Response regulator GacA [BD1-7 clade bacterium]